MYMSIGNVVNKAISLPAPLEFRNLLLNVSLVQHVNLISAEYVCTKCNSSINFLLFILFLTFLNELNLIVLNPHRQKDFGSHAVEHVARPSFLNV